MQKKYKLAALGGTFDYLHIGHHHLIKTAVKSANKVIIGLTQKSLIQDKHLSQLVQSYSKRKIELESYLDSFNVLNETSIMPLNDLYGPTINNNEIDLLVVSQQTLPGAYKINHKRRSLKLKPLPIEVADLIVDDSGRYISSTRIRSGDINRSGQVYADLFESDISFTPAQKLTVKKPQGKLFKSVQDISSSFLGKHTHICIVGDRVTQQFIDHQLPFDYVIIDHRINRKPHPTELKHWIPDTSSKLSNPAGVITAESFQHIQKILSHNSGLIEVEGEEDLLGFPLALALPLKSLVLYGQPNQGVVAITIDESKKDELSSIISHQFAKGEKIHRKDR